ncbi:hypothetical protein T459_20904 [Capsicum annuum]|uniref:Uncharacterized protein n=1 Tax=Capsicum annuum TaxID=4072 RepID=A0A2G2Z5V1_CAPAN|nr:hypothetical protein T459_20904 [Capsicum annuum]
MKSIDDKDGFYQTMKKFEQNAEPNVMSLLKEEKRIMALVKSAGDYFHRNAKRDEGKQGKILNLDRPQVLNLHVKSKNIRPDSMWREGEAELIS